LTIQTQARKRYGFLDYNAKEEERPLLHPIGLDFNPTKRNDPLLHPIPSMSMRGGKTGSPPLGVPPRSILFLSMYIEERPGHRLKLYQCCSADINDIVQRQRFLLSLPPNAHPDQHDGEKDHQGPADFSGNTNQNLDDIGDDNDDNLQGR